MDVHRGDEIGRDEREIAEAQPAETRVGAVMNVVRCPSVEENDMGFAEGGVGAARATLPLTLTPARRFALSSSRVTA